MPFSLPKTFSDAPERHCASRNADMSDPLTPRGVYLCFAGLRSF
jgi:hypothetical protein